MELVFCGFSVAGDFGVLGAPSGGRATSGRQSGVSAPNLVLTSGLALLGAVYSISMLSCLATARHRHGLWPLRRGIWRAGPALRRRRRRLITGITLIAGFARTVGWPLTARGLETYRMAQDVFRMGAPPHPVRTSAQFLPVASRDRRQGGQRPVDQTAYPDRSDDDLAGVRLCGRLDRHRRHGGAPAAYRGGLWATRVQAVVAGAMIGPAQVAARIEEASLSADSSAGLDPARLHHPSDRSRHLSLEGGGAAGVSPFFTAPATAFSRSRAVRCRSLSSAPENMAIGWASLGRRRGLRRRRSPGIWTFDRAMGSRILIVSSALSLSALLALSLLHKQAKAA